MGSLITKNGKVYLDRGNGSVVAVNVIGKPKEIVYSSKSSVSTGSSVSAPAPSTTKPLTSAAKSAAQVPSIPSISPENKGIFNNSFFSLEGQKERFSNVLATWNAAFNPFSKDKVKANVNNAFLKGSLETVSNHPYITAGVGAAAYTAGPSVVGGLSSAKGAATTAAISSTAAKVSTVKSSLLPFGAGLVGGVLASGLFGKSGANNAPQTQNPSQEVNPNINPSQNPQQRTLQDPQQGLYSNPSQGSGVNLNNSPGSSVYNVLNQDTYSTSNPITNSTSYQYNIQKTSSQIIPTQTSSQDQAASSGTNWGLIAAAGAAILLLKK